MKRYILLAAILLINITAIAQNYLGKSLATVEKQLKKDGIEYEGFVNDDGTYSIKFYNDDEQRVYVFDFSKLCNSYNIGFNKPEKIYKYGTIYANNGWKQVKVTADDKLYVKWVFRLQNLSAICHITQEEDIKKFNWRYFIIVRYK